MIFLNRFKEDRTLVALCRNFSKIKIESNERIKKFNQRFLRLRNKIPTNSRPPENVIIEFYTATLPSSMAMWVKRVAKQTLTENFNEAVQVEKDQYNLKETPSSEFRKVYFSKTKLSYLINIH